MLQDSTSTDRCHPVLAEEHVAVSDGDVVAQGDSVGDGSGAEDRDRIVLQVLSSFFRPIALFCQTSPYLDSSGAFTSDGEWCTGMTAHM